MNKTLPYVVGRLMPFALVNVGYDVLELVLLVMLGGGGGLEEEGLAFWLCDLGASFLFCMIPYLCYLLVLPAGYHGGRWDRVCTLVLFVFFTVINGLEELSEVLSGAEFHVLSARLIQDPAGTMATFAQLPGALGWCAGMLCLVAATVALLRRRLIPEVVVVPPVWQRALFVLLTAAGAFVLLSLPDGMMNTGEMPEMYRDGIISLFGDVIAMTAVPDLAQIYREPVLMTLVVVMVLFFLEGAWRCLWPQARSPWQWFCALHAGLCARYGALRVHLLLLLLALLLLRLVSLGAYPLMDTTEARYGEMARKMVETGCWLQPQFDYGVPFWGKPPLSFWGSALAMRCFGVGEMAARLAPFCATLGVALLFFAWPFRRCRWDQALAAAALLLSSVIGVIASGAVMTDAFLALGTTLSLVAFRRAMEEHAAWHWGYLVFVGAAIGLLSKGPLALVLILLPVAGWALFTRRWADLWRRLPLLRGCCLMLVLALPWYVAAEGRTPGFLRYFIVGEHIERYLVSGWKGDLYGAGHSRALGTVWLYALEAFLPWSLLLPFVLRFRRDTVKAALDNGGEGVLLWCWALAPLLFFTVARNILPAYVLPAAPAWCLLLTQRLWRSEPARHLVFACVPLLALLALFLLGHGFRYVEYRCQRELLQHWDQHSPLYYADGSVPYSAQFYSAGRARPWKGQAADGLSYLALRDDSPLHRKMRGLRGWQCVAQSHGWLLYRTAGEGEE